jgi:phosphoribosylformylglycinamidine synthase
MGKPLASLLGAYDAQMNLGLAAIGGKDSMSGTYQDINVPPTLISFACADGKKLNTISPELKRLETSFIISITKLKKMDCQITKI